MGTNAATVGIVEDDAHFADVLSGALASHPSIKKVNHWGEARAFWDAFRNESLDLLIVDIGLPDRSGVELIGMTSIEAPSLPIVALTSLQTDDVIFGSIENGASSYFLKSDLKHLVERLDEILNGGAIITPSIAMRILRSFRKKEESVPTQDQLSDREKQILQEIINGKTVQSISSWFGTSEGTVRNQIKSIYAKLHVKTRVELMRKAREIGYFK